VDVYKAIQTLYDEKRRLDKLIDSLEALEARGEAPAVRKTPARRGRKRMTAAERQQVSERMKNYWAARRRSVSDSQAAAAASDRAS
jgi:hypothetical protein